MRIAIHFDEQELHKKSFFSFWPIADKLFPLLLTLKKPKITSQVFIGSLLLHYHSYEVEKKTSKGWTERFNPKEFKKLLTLWANPPQALYCTFTEKTIESAVKSNLYVVCLTRIDKEHATKIHKSFKKIKAYRGLVEVDEAYPPHAMLYSHGLSPFGRINGSDFYVFWDGIIEDSKDEGVIEKMAKYGLRNVRFESLNGRYSIFDSRHTPEQSLLTGRTQSLCVGFLSETVERILDTLTDIAPALPEKLHAAVNSYKSASTSEQIAHSALSCRRIIEYVIDCIFPPQSQLSLEGRKLDKPAYRNRLLAYADKSRKSDTSIDLIVASTATLAEQLEKLEAAVNKGVHADLLDVEGRRCVIRTLMLLDDIISLKTDPFEMKPELKPLEQFFK